MSIGATLFIVGMVYDRRRALISAARKVAHNLGITLCALVQLYAVVFMVVSAYQTNGITGIMIALALFHAAYVVLPLMALVFSLFPAIIIFWRERD